MFNILNLKGILHEFQTRHKAYQNDEVAIVIENSQVVSIDSKFGGNPSPQALKQLLNFIINDTINELKEKTGF